MKKILLPVLVLVATASFAAVDVQKSAGFPGSIAMLAIAPLPCVDGVNCVKVEKHLNKLVPNL